MHIDSQFIEDQYRHSHKVITVRELTKLWKLRNDSWPVACDCETTGPDIKNHNMFGTPNVYMEEGAVVSEQLWPVVFGISLAWLVSTEAVEQLVMEDSMEADANGLVMVWARKPSALFQAARRLLGTDAAKVWHNAKFDLKVCEANGITVGGRQHCTLTKSRIYWDRWRTHGLKEIVKRLCPGLSYWDDDNDAELSRLKNKYTRLINAGELEWYDKVAYANYSFVPEEIMGRYAAGDAFHCFMLNVVLNERAVWQ